MEGRGVAPGKTTAADLGAYICFEDEAGQGLRPPKGRTWAPRGARPVVRVRGRGRGRVNMAGVVCFHPGGRRSHLFYKLHVYHGRKGEPKTFSWREYRDLIVRTHQRLQAPLVWCWDNLNVHLAQELQDFADEHTDWLRVFQMPTYTPELNPAEAGLTQGPGLRRFRR
jgi:hypothetical protein